MLPMRYAVVIPYLGLLACAVCCIGCSSGKLPGDYGDFVNFNDQVSSSVAAVPEKLIDIELTKTDGSTVSISDLSSQQNTLVVVSRGLVGSATLEEGGGYGHSFCIFCSTQTSRLIVNYPKFRARNTEIVLIFPIARREDAKELQRFAAKVQGEGKSSDDAPFPMVMDVELLAVDSLGIRDDLSKPSTYILDAAGKVRFAYIGKSISDRPSIKALLAQLDQINSDTN